MRCMVTGSWLVLICIEGWGDGVLVSKTASAAGKLKYWYNSAKCTVQGHGGKERKNKLKQSDARTGTGGAARRKTASSPAGPTCTSWCTSSPSLSPMHMRIMGLTISRRVLKMPDWTHDSSLSRSSCTQTCAGTPGRHQRETSTRSRRGGIRTKAAHGHAGAASKGNQHTGTPGRHQKETNTRARRGGIRTKPAHGHAGARSE